MASLIFSCSLCFKEGISLSRKLDGSSISLQRFASVSFRELGSPRKNIARSRISNSLRNNVSFIVQTTPPLVIETLRRELPSVIPIMIVLEASLLVICLIRRWNPSVGKQVVDGVVKKISDVSVTTIVGYMVFASLVSKTNWSNLIERITKLLIGKVDGKTMEEAEEQLPPTAAAKKTSGEKKPKSNRFSHPPYFQMIKEALLGLNEKGGSSSYAIAKYMEEKHRDVLPASYRKTLGVQLKNCVANQKLIKVEAFSFKLSDASKKEIKAAVELTTKSSKSVDADEKTKSRKKPTTSSSSKPKSTTAVVPTTFKKSETTTAAPKKKRTAAPAKNVAATTPTKKAGSEEEVCSWYYC